jgi:hypothetical protein
MSRTIKFAQAGGPEVLEFVETEVLVQKRFASKLRQSASTEPNQCGAMTNTSNLQYFRPV